VHPGIPVGIALGTLADRTYGTNRTYMPVSYRSHKSYTLSEPGVSLPELLVQHSQQREKQLRALNQTFRDQEFVLAVDGPAPGPQIIEVR
jgi:hypothetical protein